MALTSIDLEPDLIEKAKRATKQSTIKGAVTVALETVVRLSRQNDAIEAIAQIDSLQDLLDPEVMRSARR